MKIGDAGLRLIKESEGLRERAYPDSVGVCTIGYGHTRDVKLDDTCDEDQAMTWLLEDVADAEAAVCREISMPLTQGQFDALVDFVFNLGQGALAGSTLRRLLNAGDYAGAAAELPKWCHAGNQTLPGLVARRAKERALFEGE
jgi:lysozyme